MLINRNFADEEGTMSKKKKRKAKISELVADNKWDQVQRERDGLKVDRIKNLGTRSKVDVLIGGLFMFAAYSSLIDMVKIMSANVKGKGAGQALSIHNMVKGIQMDELVWIAVVAVAAMAFFFVAMSKNEKIDKLTDARYRWMPDEAEKKYIEKRFDNDFVRSILSEISSEDTHSIEAGLDAVTVNNSTGSSVFNFNKCGFSRLSNYDTKQLAYYLASHSFPEGFVIYQTKIAPLGSDKFIGGTTDFPDDTPPEEDEKKHTMKMYARLYEQLREFVRIKNPFKMYLREAGPSPVDNGQIVLNKGFRADREGYEEL